MKGACISTLAALALMAGCAFASAAHAGTKAPVAAKDMERLLDSFFKDVMQSVAAESSLPAGKRRSLQTVTDRFQVGLVAHTRIGPPCLDRRERRVGLTGLCRALPAAPPPAPQNVQAFFEDMLGGGWRGLVPARWANSSFDWGKLGEFGE